MYEMWLAKTDNPRINQKNKMEKKIKIKPVGKAYIQDSWKPIFSCDKIVNGKNKGKVKISYQTLVTKNIEPEKVRLDNRQLEIETGG